MRAGVIETADSRELRRRVLRPQLSIDARLPGDDLPDGVHLGAVEDDGTVLGTCFVHPDPCYWRDDGADAWRLRQMATAPERRGEGIGGLVLAAAFEFLRARAVPLVWCHAREEAVGFYERHGFHGYGEIFLDEHPIPHLRMWRELLGSSIASD